MRLDVRFEVCQRVLHRVLTHVAGGGIQLVGRLMRELADIRRQPVGVSVKASRRVLESARGLIVSGLTASTASPGSMPFRPAPRRSSARVRPRRQGL